MQHASRITVPVIAAALLSTAATPAIAQCGSEKQHAAVQAGAISDRMNIVETAIDAGSFKTLVAAVKAAGLADTLSSKGPFTVFAPTDEAFAKLPAGTVEKLLKPENKDMLVSVLTYHVVKGEQPARNVIAMDGAQTVNGQWLSFDTSKGVMINGAKVLNTDIAASNGVIHVIDTVLLPSNDTVVDIASSAGQFSTLLAACEAAGLVSALSADGPITVLAPTDEAFKKLPAGTVETLLKPENKSKLQAILKYHVIKGRVNAADAVKASSAATLQGGNVLFDIRRGRLTVNGANVINTNINASNGVVHVIDTVLMPE